MTMSKMTIVTAIPMPILNNYPQLESLVILINKATPSIPKPKNKINIEDIEQHNSSPVNNI